MKKVHKCLQTDHEAHVLDWFRYISVWTVNTPKVKLVTISKIKQNNAVVNEVSLHQNRVCYKKKYRPINKILSKNFISCFQNRELRPIDLFQLISSLCVFICLPVHVFKWQWWVLDTRTWNGSLCLLYRPPMFQALLPHSRFIHIHSRG